MALETMVERLNKGIEEMDLFVIRYTIDDLIKEGYIDRLQGEFLFQDIVNNGCTYSASSFKEYKDNENQN